LTGTPISFIQLTGMRSFQMNRFMSAILLVVAVVLFAGCGGDGIREWNPKNDRAAMMGKDAGGSATNSPDKVILLAGDPITVTFSDVPAPGIQEWKGRIGEDGNITLHLNVTIKAIGKTPNQVSQEIREAYVPKYYKYLTATVKTEERFYYVGGEVRAPGSRPYTGTMTVTRAIDTAGGFTDYAKRSELILTRADGVKFKVDYKKAIKDPVHDPVVYPNDRVEVGRRFW
jgi:polysaccharide biosynthesis/export protein VpsN